MVILMKQTILFDAEFIDDIGNEVPGTAAIQFTEIVRKLKIIGFSVKKETRKKS